MVRRGADSSSAPRSGARIGPTDVRSSSSVSKSGGSSSSIAALETAPAAVLETSVASGVSGSAFVEVGGSRVVCTVRGPRAIKRSADFGDEGSIECRVRLAPFALYRFSSGSVTSRNVETLRMKSEQYFSSALVRALKGSVRLDRFPKSVLEIDALVLSDDGEALSALISCASLAVADSGVEVLDLVASSSVGVVSGLGTELEYLQNPNSTQQARSLGVMTMSLLPSSETVADLSVKGMLSYEQAGEATKRCFEGCIRMHRQMRDHLVLKAEQAFKALDNDNDSEAEM